MSRFAPLPPMDAPPVLPQLHPAGLLTVEDLAEAIFRLLEDCIVGIVEGALESKFNELTPTLVKSIREALPREAASVSPGSPSLSPSSTRWRYDGPRPLVLGTSSGPAEEGVAGCRIRPRLEREESGLSAAEAGDRPSYGSRPTFGNRPAFGHRPSWGSRPSFPIRTAFGSATQDREIDPVKRQSSMDSVFSTSTRYDAMKKKFVDLETDIVSSILDNSVVSSRANPKPTNAGPSRVGMPNAIEHPPSPGNVKRHKERRLARMTFGSEVMPLGKMLEASSGAARSPSVLPPPSPVFTCVSDPAASPSKCKTWGGVMEGRVRTLTAIIPTTDDGGQAYGGSEATQSRLEHWFVLAFRGVGLLSWEVPCCIGYKGTVCLLACIALASSLSETASKHMDGFQNPICKAPTEFYSERGLMSDVVLAAGGLVTLVLLQRSGNQNCIDSVVCILQGYAQQHDL
eukprot:CAMPEP_0204116794 /NCGR_PEP_ID=MMETSP0361-20130328/5615_1 /ASSEMBLY_ACC=CAM_ASM_000343 /TAXON_ID=268821 /ORGANISM="Scrippsiella Hangoei, Strain SHTV-5" /LENGTH=456 /DNA_ID=CAMNT_0051067641 /DNA_START=61 /DNA_END=1428 /DNA_ORIENTATION=+